VQFVIYLLMFLMQVTRIYVGIIFIYCLLTWIPGAMDSKLGQLLARLVEPFLGVFDRIIPAIGGIGFSAIIAGFVLYLVERGLGTIIQILAMRYY